MYRSTSIIIGFSFFGFLIGYITGITEAEITNSIITILFAFVGGKLFLDIGKMNSNERKIKGVILSSFSIVFFLGLNLGIFSKSNRIFDNIYNSENLKKENISLSKQGATTPNPYLPNSYLKNSINALQVKYRNGDIGCDSTLKIMFEYYNKPK